MVVRGECEEVVTALADGGRPGEVPGTAVIEEGALRMRGGGVGLFTGCAAGDTAAALVLRVED